MEAQTETKEYKAFMRDIENEAIDKSQWIKRSEAAEIAKKHTERLNGWESIADALLRTGYLERQHKDYGLDYFDLKNAVFGALQIKTSAGMYKMGDASLKRNNAERVYLLVSKAIGKEAECALYNALNKAPDNSLRFSFVANVYRNAFEVLEAEIDNALKKISEEE